MKMLFDKAIVPLGQGEFRRWIAPGTGVTAAFLEVFDVG
jgi:hypothetical protein